MAAAVAPMTGSASPCMATASAARPRATTPLRMARTFLLGMSLSQSLGGAWALAESYFLSETALASFNSLEPAFSPAGSTNGVTVLATICTVTPGAIFTFARRVVHLHELADEARVRHHAVALLQRLARRPLLLLPARHQQEEGHEDDEHHQDGHEARDAAIRRPGCPPSAGGLRGNAGRARLGLDVLGEEELVAEEGG